MAGIRLYKGYSKKNFRVGVVKQKPIPEENPVVVIRPTWISAGDLGTYESGEEVQIALQYSDPSNIVEEFILTGMLPPGLLLNTLNGVISGYLNESASNDYSFVISMRTKLNQIVQQQFSISTIAYESVIVWETEPNLGTYNVGDSVSGNIGAYSEEVQA